MHTLYSRDLLSGSVARLGSDIASMYPQLRGSEEEEEEVALELFCLVFARYEDKGLRRLQVLRPDTSILKLFSAPNAADEHCLLLHSKEQNHLLEPFPSPYPATLQQHLRAPSPATSSANDTWDGDSDTPSISTYSHRGGGGTFNCGIQSLVVTIKCSGVWQLTAPSPS